MHEKIERVAKISGEIVLNYFKPGLHIEYKEDNSPVTLADTKSHDYLEKNLKQIANLPVLSEEIPVEYSERKNWDKFWMIDPLDGTKEFINGYSDFCINIALIEKNYPIIGLIYAPAKNWIFKAEKNMGFEYSGKIPERDSDKIIVGQSRFHNSAQTQNFNTINDISNFSTVGAALKFGFLATRRIDIYPRFEGSKEWDTAAGQIILQEANCSILDLKTNKIPIYNKEILKNNFFIAYSNSLDLNKFKIPEPK